MDKEINRERIKEKEELLKRKAMLLKEIAVEKEIGLSLDSEWAKLNG